MLVASFPGPAQLFVVCSTEKRGEPGMFCHMGLRNRQMAKNFRTKKQVLRIVQPTTRSTFGVYDSRPLLARYVR